MKLLFDQNLLHKLVAWLAAEFPGSAHMRDVGLERAADSLVWSHAAANGFAIVSKNVDFRQRAIQMGDPPKVIWIRMGNRLTSSVATLLRSHCATLLAFEANPSASFIALA